MLDAAGGEWARIIDANANRAREALRTLEDVARFRLNDGALSGRIKAVRHEVRGALACVPGGDLALYAHRDTPGDAGVGIKTEAEGARSGLPGVVVAAGRRAGEALRVLEEVLKSGGWGESGWRRMERARYELYEVEKRLALALGTGRGRQWRVCVLITESLCSRPWREVAAAAMRGGADCLQLREPVLGDAELLRRARELVALRDEHTMRACLPAGAVAVIINNRVDVALASNADGVHLGTGDLPIGTARGLCGDRLLIGASTHDLAEARAAVEQGADYCGVGAMFASQTKERPVSGPGYLRDYLSDPALARVPHLAIGGVTVDRARELHSASALGVAVSRAVCSVQDPEAVCRELRETFVADREGGRPADVATGG